MGDTKIVIYPYSKKSHQHVLLQDLYGKITDPGDSNEIVRYSFDLIIYLLDTQDNNIVLNVMNFVENYEAILNMTSGAQIFNNFLPKESSFDKMRYLTALFYMIKKLTLFEDKAIWDNVSLSEKSSAKQKMSLLLQCGYIKQKLTKPNDDPYLSLEALKFFLNTIIEGQQIIFLKID